jgi:hypothetical protein
VKRVILFAVIACFLAGAVAANAEVTIKHKSSTEMGGMMSMEMSRVETYKSDRCYTESTSKMTGGMMAMMGKGKPTQSVEITRLDKGVLWQLDIEKKKYSEEALASFKAKLEDAKEDSKKDQPEYTWTMEVTQIPTPQNINGFDCKGVIGKATGVNKKKTADTLFITYEQWMTDKVKGTAEVDEYQKNYAKAVGIDEMWAQENMATALGQYGNEFAELAIKVNQAGNYPIKTIITVEAAGVPADGESGSANRGDMMSQMSKMFGKKNAEKPAGEDSGRTKSFMMTNEVLSVETSAIGDTKFEIPADYKKK